MSMATLSENEALKQALLDYHEKDEYFTDTDPERFEIFFRAFPEVFPKDSESTKLPPLRPGCNHKVEFIENATTDFTIPNIRTPEKFMKNYWDFIDRWLAAGICAPAEAVAACPIWAIPKPGKPDEPRFVTDLRKRNKITKDERQPLINQELMRETAA